MILTGSLCRAARALARLPRDFVARSAGVDPQVLADFEIVGADPGPEARDRLRAALERGGAVFIAEDGEGGAGVRLKFTAPDARAITRQEGEGGPVGDDDV